MTHPLSIASLPEIERLQSYFERKRTKSEALKRWVSSYGDSEDKIAVSEKRKRSRNEMSGFLSENNNLFVRILNHCSCTERESSIFYGIDSQTRGLGLHLMLLQKKWGTWTPNLFVSSVLGLTVV